MSLMGFINGCKRDASARDYQDCLWFLFEQVNQFFSWSAHRPNPLESWDNGIRSRKTAV